MAITPPGCGVGREIALSPVQAWVIELPRAFQSFSVMRWLRQDGFMLTVN
jgi:hypothetical protein